MRKSLFIQSVLIVTSAFLILACNKKENQSTEPTNETTSQDSITGGTSTLQVALIKDMVKRYQAVGNSDQNAGQNTQSIWFDLKTLKQFVDQVESISKSNDASVDISKLGIRVYLSTYPKSDTWNADGFPDLESLNNNDITLQYALKNTVILIPTIFSDGANRDFDPLRTETYGPGMIVSGAMEAALFSTSAVSNTSDDDKVMALNHGTLVPPPVEDQVTTF